MMNNNNFEQLDPQYDDEEEIIISLTNDFSLLCVTESSSWFHSPYVFLIYVICLFIYLIKVWIKSIEDEK